jgi:hypothetical protein
MEHCLFTHEKIKVEKCLLTKWLYVWPQSAWKEQKLTHYPHNFLFPWQAALMREVLVSTLGTKIKQHNPGSDQGGASGPV